MAAYVQDSQFFSRRIIVFFVIVVFHVLLVWALATGLARHIVEVIAPPIQTDIIEEVKKDEAPPPPPPPQMERPPVEVPPPDISIDVPVETNTTAITNVTDKPVVHAPPPPPAAVVRVGAKLDQKHSPPTDDYYPPTSRRMSEEGVTTVRACMAVDGKVNGTPTVVKSSGFERLDEAAVKWAQRARWIPGTEDGKPVESCNQFNVRFKLTE